MGVGPVLAAGRPGTVMLVDGDHLAESTVGLEGIGRDRAGGVVGDVQVPTVGVDADMARGAAMAGDTIDRRQRAVDRIDAKRRDASALEPCRLGHGIEDRSTRVRSEERRMLDVVEPAQLDGARCGIGPVMDMNADRGVVRVAADVEQDRRALLGLGMTRTTVVDHTILRERSQAQPRP